MATISIKIDLRQLKHIVQKLKRKDGKTDAKPVLYEGGISRTTLSSKH